MKVVIICFLGDNETKTEIESLYDKETGLYYLKNKVTNEIIYASKYKEDLKFYEEHPDYNPNPLAPKKTELSDFLDDGIIK